MSDAHLSIDQRFLKRMVELLEEVRDLQRQLLNAQLSEMPCNALPPVNPVSAKTPPVKRR